MEELAFSHELPKVLVEHRGLSKLKSTYTDKLPQMVNLQTGRVHTSYHQAVTATGRLSSSDPNLQNIPIRNEEGRRIRQAFIAREGFTVVAADYSQIELRIMAHLSQDQGLINAFTQGKDIHRSTAAEIFGIALDEVTSEQRRNAKAINFGLIYGMSAFGLSRQLGITVRMPKAIWICISNAILAYKPLCTIFAKKPKPKAMWKPYSAVVYICRISTPLTVCAVKLPNVSRSMHQCKALPQTLLNEP